MPNLNEPILRKDVESQPLPLVVSTTSNVNVVRPAGASIMSFMNVSINRLLSSLHFQQFDPLRKQLVLDLDETLISSSQKHANKHDFSVRVYFGGIPATFYVRKRPHVEQFLETVSQWFEVIVFTASLSPYANAVIDKIDPKRRISRRLYRQSCTNKSGSYVKNLQLIRPDLSKVAIVDNSPTAYSCNKENGIPIDDWYGNNAHDGALINLLPLLEELKNYDDVRECLAKNQVLQKNHKAMEHLNKKSHKASISNS